MCFFFLDTLHGWSHTLPFVEKFRSVHTSSFDQMSVSPTQLLISQQFFATKKQPQSTTATHLGRGIWTIWDVVENDRSGVSMARRSRWGRIRPFLSTVLRASFTASASCLFSAEGWWWSEGCVKSCGASFLRRMLRGRPSDWKDSGRIRFTFPFG